MVEKTKRHIENYKKQDIFADATQAREGIETRHYPTARTERPRCNSSP